MREINLLPWRERMRDEKRRQFLLVFGVSFILSISIMVFFHFNLRNSISIQRAKNMFLRNEVGALDDQLSMVAQYDKRKEDLLSRMRVIQKLQATRQQVVRVFDELLNVIPKGVYLIKITREGDKIVLSGEAQTNNQVSDLMRNIQESHWFNKPVLNEIKTVVKKGSPQSTFKLQMLQAAVDQNLNNKMVS